MTQLISKSYKYKTLILLTVLVMGLGFALNSYAQNEGDVAAGETSLLYKIVMKNGLGAGGIKDGLSKVSFSNSDEMQAFYEARGHKPVWISRMGNTDDAEEVLEVLEAAWIHGLNPDNYHVVQIRELLDNPMRTDKAHLELLVSDAVMRYGRDISGMRIDPNTIRQRAEYWRTPKSEQEVMAAVANSSDPAEALEKLAPRTALYKAMQKELIRLSQEGNGYDHVLPMDFSGDHHFTPGQTHKDVKALRVRLGVSHSASQGSESYYDDNTAAAVMAFQREHGLEPDGIIGPQTLAVLNRGNRDRMEQIVANMERHRWLEQDRPDRYILVNIPQQLLWAVEKGKVMEEMKVVVGLPFRKTKDFKAEVTGVRFNPTWTVPINLKMQDFLPKLKEDPGYLSEKKIEVIKGYGHEAVNIDPMSVDWENVSWKEMGQMRFVQSPGDHNALGRVRILMPNGYNIYMHDTNHPEFFERGQRTYSSGCVRLEKPKNLASFILRHNRGWNNGKMEETIATGKLTEVSVDEPFPVYIIYQSMWLDEKGRLVFGPDVYKRDKELLEVLAQIDGYKLPVSGEVRHAALDNDSAALAYNQ